VVHGLGNVLRGRLNVVLRVRQVKGICIHGRIISDPRTDSELRKRWDQIVGSSVSEHVREREIIVMEWLEILERKRAGEITDSSRIDVVEEAVQQLAAIHGIPLEFSESEARCEEDLTPSSFCIVADYAGPKAIFNPKRFLAFVIQATEELIPLNVIMPWGKPGANDKEFYSCHITSCLGNAKWLTDNHFWDGPVTIRYKGKRPR
jgi:hypothetical protein